MQVPNWLHQTGQVLYRAGKSYMDDNGSKWAAAIAYYGLLSTFPLLLAGVAIAAYFVQPQQAIDQILRVLGDFIPQGSAQVEEVVRQAIEQRGNVGLLSLLGLLWSGSRVFSTITTALNVSLDDKPEYGFIRQTLIQLAMLASVGLLFILALAAEPLLYPLISAIGLLPQELSFLLHAALTAVPILLLLLAFFLTYRFVPREDIDWRASLAGAVLATLLVVAARPLFSYYVQFFADYNLIYGPLAIAVILIFWAWILGQILLLCGQIALQIREIMIESKTPE